MSDGSKSYRLWDPKRHCVFEAREVKFDELIIGRCKIHLPLIGQFGNDSILQSYLSN